MNTPRLALLGLALPALILANESYPDLTGMRFEMARTAIRSEVVGRLNSYWRSERGTRDRLGQSFRHYLGVTNRAELDALKADAARRGQTHIDEVARRELIARESAELAADGVVERGEALMAASWDRFRTRNQPTQFAGVPQVKAAFYEQSPELVDFMRRRVPLEFSGEAVGPNWLAELTPEQAFEPVLEEDAPRVGIPADGVEPVDTTGVDPMGGMTVGPISGGGSLFGVGETQEEFTGEADLSQVVTVPTPAPAPGERPPEPAEPSAAIVPPTVDGDNDAASVDTGWKTIKIVKDQTLGDLGVEIRRGIDRNLRPPLWGPEGIVDLLYQANMGHIADPNVLKIGDLVRVPTNAWFETN